MNLVSDDTLLSENAIALTSDSPEPSKRSTLYGIHRD